jgi:hypothetical protein
MQRLGSSISKTEKKTLHIFFFEGITVYVKQTDRLIKNLTAPFGTLGGKECVWNLSLSTKLG